MDQMDWREVDWYEDSKLPEDGQEVYVKVAGFFEPVKATYKEKLRSFRLKDTDEDVYGWDQRILEWAPIDIQKSVEEVIREKLDQDKVLVFNLLTESASEDAEIAYQGRCHDIYETLNDDQKHAVLRMLYIASIL